MTFGAEIGDRSEIHVTFNRQIFHTYSTMPQNFEGVPLMRFVDAFFGKRGHEKSDKARNIYQFYAKKYANNFSTASKGPLGVEKDKTQKFQNRSKVTNS